MVAGLQAVTARPRTWRSAKARTSLAACGAPRQCRARPTPLSSPARRDGRGQSASPAGAARAATRRCRRRARRAAHDRPRRAVRAHAGGGRQLEGSEQLVQLFKRSATDQCHGAFQAVTDAADGFAPLPARSCTASGRAAKSMRVPSTSRNNAQASSSNGGGGRRGSGSAMTTSLPAWACTWGRGQAADQLRWVPTVGRHGRSACIQPKQRGPTVRTHPKQIRTRVAGQRPALPCRADQRSAHHPIRSERNSGRGRSSTRRCCRSATARRTAGCRSSGYRCWIDPGSCRSVSGHDRHAPLRGDAVLDFGIQLPFGLVGLARDVAITEVEHAGALP